jgi:hypothetical protein
LPKLLGNIWHRRSCARRPSSSGSARPRSCGAGGVDGADHRVDLLVPAVSPPPPGAPHSSSRRADLDKRPSWYGQGGHCPAAERSRGVQHGSRAVKSVRPSRSDFISSWTALYVWRMAYGPICARPVVPRILQALGPIAAVATQPFGRFPASSLGAPAPTTDDGTARGGAATRDRQEPGRSPCRGYRSCCSAPRWRPGQRRTLCGGNPRRPCRCRRRAQETWLPVRSGRRCWAAPV